MKTINPHDKFFKTVFSYPEEAMDFVKGTVPKEIVEKLDFSTFQIDKTSYITGELKEYYSDVVYNCRFGNEKKNKLSF